MTNWMMVSGSGELERTVEEVDFYLTCNNKIESLSADINSFFCFPINEVAGAEDYPVSKILALYLCLMPEKMRYLVSDQIVSEAWKLLCKMEERTL